MRQESSEKIEFLDEGESSNPKLSLTRAMKKG